MPDSSRLYLPATCQTRIVDDQRLAALIQILSRHRLGLDDVEPDILGRAYEYLLRKFAEGQGQAAGEFYTPREVAVLLARLLDPQPGMIAPKGLSSPTAASSGRASTRRVCREHPLVDGRP